MRNEPGTLQFEIMRPRGADSTLMTYEVYEQEDAFETHPAARSLAQLFSEITDIITDLRGTRCTSWIRERMADSW